MDQERSTSALEPLRIAPAYGHVVERLKRAIHLGEYLPGDKLPSERDLAGQLGVSRVTVREGLRILQGEGYVESRRGAAGGPVVLAQSEPVALLRGRLRERLPELEANFEFRMANERATARLAAVRRTAEDIAGLEANLEEMRESEGLAGFRRADSGFHLAVAEAARNPLLRRAVEDARAATFGTFDALDFEVILSSTLEEHREIVEAVEAADADRAERAMVEHLETARGEILAVLGARDGGD